MNVNNDHEVELVVYSEYRDIWSILAIGPLKESHVKRLNTLKGQIAGRIGDITDDQAQQIAKILDLPTSD